MISKHLQIIIVVFHRVCGKRSKTDSALLAPAALLEPPAHDANSSVGAFDFLRELADVRGGATDTAPQKKSSGASEAGKANRQVGTIG